MITAIIVDDEQKSIYTLEQFLRDYCRQVQVTGTAENAVIAKELIRLKKPQLVFLDIEMPYGNGFDLLKSFSAIDFEIIFITAFNQYGINAFRFSAIDYLLKPVNIPELIDAVSRAEKRITEKKSIENYNLLLQNINEKDTAEQQIVLTDNKGQHIFKLKDIVFCIADGSYTEFHFANSKIFTTSKSLKEFEDLLPADGFSRIHHGHIVNIKHIVKILNGRGGSVIMTDGSQLEIAVRKKESFLKAYKR